MRWMTSGLIAAVLAATATPALAGPDDQRQEQEQEQQPQQPSAYQDNQQQPQDSFEYEAASGPRLGIMVTGLTAELRSFYGVPTDRGVLVARVAPNSAAARAGLRVGDILVAVQSSTISSADDVIQVLENLQRGETFPLTIVRDHRAMTLQARLARPHQQNRENKAELQQHC